jgi:hypothetical protein
MSGIGKRLPNLPKAADGILDRFSKADILEAAWHLASLANEAGSVDDDQSTRARLIEELNTHIVARGGKPVKLG